MASFYNSNLMDGYDSKLIPLETDLKKEEEIIELDDNDDETNNTLKIQSFSSAPIEYPYRHIIRRSQNLTLCLIIFFFAHSFFVTLPQGIKENENYPSNCLDPCNSSTVIPLAENSNIKDKIQGIEKEMTSINTVTGYNISTFTNEYLTEKYANLSTTFTNLKQQLQEQKDIRFACFKANLEKRCEAKMSSPYIYNRVYVYVLTCAILLTNSFYYISKAKKLDLTDEQLKECNTHCVLSKMIFVHACFVCAMDIAFTRFWLVNDGCDIEKYLDKFPANLFF